MDGADINQLTEPKTFTVDISDIVQQRITEFNQNGISDDQLQFLLQKFISDIANADVIPENNTSTQDNSWVQDTHIQQLIVDDKNKSIVIHP